MRFMMFMYPGLEQESDWQPSAEDVAAMSAYNQELQKAGVLLALDGLHPSSQGARVSFSGGRPTVTDGPFAETKELVAGFWLIQAKSKEEAIEWMSRAPFDGGVEIELRQVFELDDFGDIVTPSIRERQERLHSELEAR
jgi:hypothetical protein